MELALRSCTGQTLSPRSRPMTSATPFRVRPLWLGIIAFVAGSVFVVLYGIGASILHWPDIVTASAEAGLHAFIILLLWKSCPRNWTPLQVWAASTGGLLDRKSTRLNSSHLGISYAVFCLKKKKLN